MLIQSAANKRCASCARWSGQRQVAEQAGMVAVDAEIATGLCVGGPWDNSERRARSACGHWLIWDLLLAPPPSPPNSCRDDQEIGKPGAA